MKQNLEYENYIYLLVFLYFLQLQFVQLLLDLVDLFPPTNLYLRQNNLMYYLKSLNFILLPLIPRIIELLHEGQVTIQVLNEENVKSKAEVLK